MYTITLNNGTKLENLELNGNNFISNSIINDEVFKDNLKTVTISNENTTDTYDDMVLIQNQIYENQSWFILAEKTPEQKEKEALLTNFTNIELAMAEMYEQLLGGM